MTNNRRKEGYRTDKIEKSFVFIKSYSHITIHGLECPETQNKKDGGRGITKLRMVLKRQEWWEEIGFLLM